MDTYPDLKEFLELLNKNKVEYLIVGGYAASLYSRPRYTKDLDIWINPTITNARKVRKTLDEFGFEKMDISIEDLTNKDQFIQLGFEPARIDLITSLVGIKFKEAFRNRNIGLYGDLRNVNFISVEDLIKNKKESGRKQDLFDVYWIEKYSTKKRKK